MQIKIYGKFSVEIREKYHYVYRITNISENKHYYGKRSSLNPPQEDLYFNYKSSSSDEYFINEQKINPENFKYKIIFICSSSKKALDKEKILHKKFDVARNSNFYNKIFTVYDKYKNVYCVIDTFEDDFLLKMKKYNLPSSVFNVHKPGEPFYVCLLGSNSKGANISIGKLNNTCSGWKSVVEYSYSVIQFNSLKKRQQYFNSTHGKK